MRILIYARVSTDMQTTQTQIEKCIELAKKHSDKKPILFVDDDCSTSKPMEERRELQKFLNEICIDDLVIVYNLDRIGRDILEGIKIYREIKYLGARITSVENEHCDNELWVNIKFTLAQEEKRLISERTKHALISKQKRFEKVGTVWYGYQLDPNIIQTKERARTFGKPYKLIPNPKEQEALQLMKSLREEGFSYGEIASKLCEAGHMSRAGRPFEKGSIHRILQRELNHPVHQEKVVLASLV